MPLLKREADITPGLFDLDASMYPWRVVHVRSRQEKVLARHCFEREIPFYLPLTANEVVSRPSAGDTPATDDRRPTPRNPQSAIRNPKSRIRLSYNPLFPGYLFVRAPRSENVALRTSNVIVSFLEVTDQQILAAELGQIYALQQSGAILVPFPWLTTGDTVRIREGAFKGYQGVIVKEKGEDRFVVSISMIMRSVIVELGREFVAPGSVARVGDRRVGGRALSSGRDPHPRAERGAGYR